MPKGSWCYFALNDEAKIFVETFEVNPLVDPCIQERLVQAIQRKRGVKYSWGGYLENRSDFMVGQYMKPSEAVHRGVDYNVPVNTKVPVPGKLVQSYQDFDQDGGWGGKLVFQHMQYPLYFILGHLKDIVTDLDRVYMPGEIVGRIAGSDSNGNWYPHLHVQCMTKEFPKLDMDVDGYGSMYKGIDKDFPNPEMVFDTLWLQRRSLDELTKEAQELDMGY